MIEPVGVLVWKRLGWAVLAAIGCGPSQAPSRPTLAAETVQRAPSQGASLFEVPVLNQPVRWGHGQSPAQEGWRPLARRVLVSSANARRLVKAIWRHQGHDSNSVVARVAGLAWLYDLQVKVASPWPSIPAATQGRGAAARRLVQEAEEYAERLRRGYAFVARSVPSLRDEAMLLRADVNWCHAAWIGALQTSIAPPKGPLPPGFSLVGAVASLTAPLEARAWEEWDSVAASAADGHVAWGAHQRLEGRTPHCDGPARGPLGP